MSEATERKRIFTALYPEHVQGEKPFCCAGCSNDRKHGCKMFVSREHACRTGECRGRVENA